MSDLKNKVPRLTAWDAEERDDGWCVDIKDLKKYLEELLNKADESSGIDALAVLEGGIKELVEHLAT